MEVDAQELRRDIDRLRKDLERVSDQATRRQDEFGAVRARAERVEVLEERVRELSRDIARLSGRAPAAAPTGAGSPSSVDDLTLAVAERLRETGLLAQVVQDALHHELSKAGGKGGLGDLAKRAYGDLKTSGVEEKLTSVLQERARTEVDPKALVNAAVDRLLRELDLKSLTQRVADVLVERIQVTTRPAK